MALINCRDHGGTFERLAKRGRPPVRCTDDNMCTEHPNGRTRKPSRKTGAPLPDSLTPRTKRQAPVEPPESPVEATTAVPRSVAKALEAKGLLEPQGWTCTAKRLPTGSVEFHASRGTERLAILIGESGTVLSQDYSLWDTQKDSANQLPPGARKLPFNPDEMSDAELAKMLSERQLIWWNRISGKEETAACPAKVQITHTFNGHDDEVPADRVITFIDMHGSGFRTLRQGALMRLDK